MTLPAAAPTNIVLDRPLVQALLFLAVAEGLLDSDPKIGDGYVANLMAQKPPEHVINLALEQLVLGGTVFAPFPVPPDLNGDIFERGILVAAKPSDAAAVEIQSMSTELMLGMLESRGALWSAADLYHRYAEFLKAHQAWEAVSGGLKYEEVAWRHVAHLINDQVPDCSPEQLLAYEALGAEYRKLAPALDCLRSYESVLNMSLELSALSSLPIGVEVAAPLQLTPERDGTERLNLFRVTCRALRRIPVGTTLRETIALAESPEAQALRNKLTEWTGAVRNGDASSAALVMDEVVRARKELATAKTLSRAGEISTVVGGIVAIGGAFAGPVGTALGIAVSVAGCLVLSGQKAKEHMHRWAMYG